MATVPRAGSRLTTSLFRSKYVAVGVGALAAVGLPAMQRMSFSLGSMRAVTPAPVHWLHRSQSTLSGLFSSTSTSSIMSALTPPQTAPVWTHSAEDVLRLTKEAIAEERKLQDKVAALKPEECNFSSVCLIASRSLPLRSQQMAALIGFRESLRIYNSAQAGWRQLQGFTRGSQLWCLCNTGHPDVGVGLASRRFGFVTELELWVHNRSQA